AMNGIRFVVDEKGRKVAVLVDLKKHGALWRDFWDALLSETRRKEKSIPYERYRATRLKRLKPRPGSGASSKTRNLPGRRASMIRRTLTNALPIRDPDP